MIVNVSYLKVSISPQPAVVAMSTMSRLRRRIKLNKKSRRSSSIMSTAEAAGASMSVAGATLSENAVSATAKRMLVAREWLALARLLDRCFLMFFLLATLLLLATLILYGFHRLTHPRDPTRGDADYQPM